MLAASRTFLFDSQLEGAFDALIAQGRKEIGVLLGTVRCGVRNARVADPAGARRTLKTRRWCAPWCQQVRDFNVQVCVLHVR